MLLVSLLILVPISSAFIVDFYNAAREWAFGTAANTLTSLSSNTKELYHNLVAVRNPKCALHIAKESIKYTKQANDASHHEIISSYLATYTESEKRNVTQATKLNMIPHEKIPIDHQHMLKRYGEYTSLSYCGMISKLNKLASLNMRVGEFAIENYGLDNTGRIIYLVLTNRIQNVTVLSLRGTANSDDIDLDLTSTHMTPPLRITYKPSKGLIHRGFWTRFADYRDRIGTALKSVVGKSQSNVIVVGHSLGACWSILQAADLATNWGVKVAAVYSYAAPICANLEYQMDLVRTIELQQGTFIRVANENDIAPLIGFAPGGAQPAVKEYWYPPSSNDAVICQHASSCNGRYKCTETTWMSHSKIGKLYINSQYCDMNSTIPTSVYE